MIRVVLIFIALIFSNTYLRAEIHFTESFTAAFNTSSYNSGTITLSSGVWDYNQIRGEISANSVNGTGSAARLNRLISGGSYLITPSVNTIETISFNYRELNSGGGTFKVQKSVNGGAFVDVETQAFSGTTYALYTLTINDANNNIRIKILSDNNAGFLIVDELTLTSIITDPTLTINPSSLTNFSYYSNSGPSSSQSFSISGSNLTGAPGNINVAAPSDYEISLDNSTFSSGLNVPYTSASLASTTVYVRLKAGLAVGSYNSENISISGGGASNVTVSCSGSVTPVPSPSLVTNPTTLSGFTYIVGSGPSTSQSYTISGTWLTGYPGNITITAPTNYEISTDNTNFINSVTVPYTSATLGSTTIYVRLKASLGVNSYNAELITISGGGASNITVTCSGSVTAIPPPYLSASSGALTSFTYVVGNGPSSSQTTNIGGTNLTGYPGNITVTASTNYEISLDNSIFSTSLTIPYSGATLTSTPLFMRLKSSLAVGSYNDEGLTVSGGGANTITIFCSGLVTEMSTECGNETFINIPTSSSSSYLARTWTGDDGGTWNATNARTDQTITSQSICFKGYAESPVSANGIGSLTITTKFPFSDGTMDLPVFVNEIQIGTVPVSSTVTTTTITDINIEGNIQVKFQSDGIKRPAIDDLSWTCYVPAPTPILTLSTATLSGFSYIYGYGPSASQSFELSGSELTGYPENIAVYAPTNYEISTDNIIFACSLLLPFNSENLTSVTIYVRLKSDLIVNIYNSEFIDISGGGASLVKVSCNGEVYAVPNPSISVSTETLSGFTYVLGSGPSASQIFLLSGTWLTGFPGNITLTAPEDYEISTDNANFYDSFAIHYYSDTLDTTTVYIRLKVGLAVNTYNSEYITISGGGGNSSILCNGYVTNFPAPVINSVTVNGNYKIGSNVPVIIHADASGYTAGAMTVQGQAASDFTDNGDNTYTVYYSVFENDNDVANASEIQLSLVLDNQGSQNSPYTTVPTGIVSIDAHRPLIDSVVRISDTELLVFLNEFADANTISVANDAGFIVTNIFDSLMNYSVTAANSGNTDREIILTVNNSVSSALTGLRVWYVAGGNGAISDVAGNLMNSTAAIIISAWMPDGEQRMNSENSNITIYPNPAHAAFTITHNNAEYVEIVNQLGQIVLQQELSENNSLIILKNHTISPGTYFVKIYCKSAVAVKKIVIE
ncbi:MAG: hypothetical protein A2309_13795 [Bacteroidetes bacterium RIFOXYB2_FULL_35_7]|nr:MAG: hypothetical protein A2X01_09805 [Bacteroidetes bacterium GWF2_35_48]OFY94385.1 MAG: hypothetical protein A2309_13795 [Bacteroidetes bacterium RIFOXYB2_FULL_35_7]HBX51611.1 hypothetical protein [Bacteroidales bacterium]